MTATQKGLEVKTVMQFWDTVIALTMSLEIVVTHVSIPIMDFQAVDLAIVTQKDLQESLVNTESVIVRVRQFLETNVISVLRVIMIFHTVILVNVQMKEVLILFAMLSLETVIALKM